MVLYSFKLLFECHFYLTGYFLSPPLLIYRGFPGSSAGKEPTYNAGDVGLIPGRSPGDGTGHPLQYSWDSLVAQMVKNLLAMLESWVDPWVGKIPWRRERLPTPVFLSAEFHVQRSLANYSPWGHRVGHD